MKVLKIEQIRLADAYTIKNEPILSTDLMERAALACVQWINKRFDTRTKMKILCGTGNNGGDGLAIARLLADLNYDVVVNIIMISESLSIDSKINLKRLEEQNKVILRKIKSADQIPSFQEFDVILDCLFGSGLSRPLSGFPAQVVSAINKSGKTIVSIDIPSGLFGDDNVENSGIIIKANYTLTFQVPKLSFFTRFASNYIGQWYILPIGLSEEFIEKQPSEYFYINKDALNGIIKKRHKFAHKGNFGHALLISGSYGKMGACVLAAMACLRTGVGLVTCHIPEAGYNILQTVLPEAMVSIDSNNNVVSILPDLDKFKHIGIGPGIGLEKPTENLMEDLLSKVHSPMVIDADGLNILSKNKEWFQKIPEESILTPHPKEFERLVGEKTTEDNRLSRAQDFASQYKVYLVLKGAYTAIVCPSGEVCFNSTGNPGMATAGSGDVLTGIILSLLNQGYEPKWAAVFGVYLHGKAGDIAAKEEGEEFIIASDIIKNLGKSFAKLK